MDVDNIEININDSNINHRKSNSYIVIDRMKIIVLAVVTVVIFVITLSYKNAISNVNDINKITKKEHQTDKRLLKGPHWHTMHPTSTDDMWESSPSPTKKPSKHTVYPTQIVKKSRPPTKKPTHDPTHQPTNEFDPTPLPTKEPSEMPTYLGEPTPLPTLLPSPSPSYEVKNLIIITIIINLLLL